MDESMKAKILDVVAFLYERSEETGYGLYTPEDPNDFFPDPECSTEEERARHEAACAAWARGEGLPVDQPWTTHKSREEAEAYVESCFARGAASATVADPEPEGLQRWTVHCHVGGWGLGTYVIRDPEMLAAAKTLEAIAAEMPEP